MLHDPDDRTFPPALEAHCIIVEPPNSEQWNPSCHPEIRSEPEWKNWTLSIGKKRLAKDQGWDWLADPKEERSCHRQRRICLHFVDSLYRPQRKGHLDKTSPTTWLGACASP